MFEGDDPPVAARSRVNSGVPNSSLTSSTAISSSTIDAGNVRNSAISSSVRVPLRFLRRKESSLLVDSSKLNWPKVSSKLSPWFQNHSTHCASFTCSSKSRSWIKCCSSFSCAPQSSIAASWVAFCRSHCLEKYSYVNVGSWDCSLWSVSDATLHFPSAVFNFTCVERPSNKFFFTSVPTIIFVFRIIWHTSMITSCFISMTRLQVYCINPVLFCSTSVWCDERIIIRPYSLIAFPIC